MQSSYSKLPKIFWIYWHQGWNNAPYIAKKCLQSWKAHNKDWDIRPLDSSSLSKYVMLDGYIPDIESKHMSLTAFSNIVRITLLKEIGGVWVDSTCFCMRPLDEWLPEKLSQGFFAFSSPSPSKKVASWFLAGDNHNRIIAEWFSRTVEYWDFHNRPHKHFWFHSLFNALYDENTDFQRTWDQTPKVSCDLDKKDGPHKLVPYGKVLPSPIMPEIQKVIDNKEVPLFKLSVNYGEIGYLMRPQNSVINYLLNQVSQTKGEKIFYFMGALKNDTVRFLKKVLRKIQSLRN